MAEIPADWYDDPENPSLYRYWDGTQWTEHRSPKHAPPPPGGQSTNVVGLGFSLCGQHWKSLLAIGAISFAIFALGAGLAFAAVANAVDPGLWTIFERVTDPSFNPERSLADQAFIDSISFDPGVGFWPLAVVGALLTLVGQVLSYGLFSVFLARAHVRGSATVKDAWHIALRRVPRWIGVSLLWMLGLGVIVGVIGGLAVLLGGAAALLLLLGIPAFIWSFPFLWLAPDVLFFGDRNEPPLRTVARHINARGWRKVAWPVLLINLTLVGVNLGTSLLSAVPFLNIVVALAGPFVLTMLGTAMAVHLWESIDGRFGDDVTGDGPAPRSEQDTVVV